MLRRDLERYHRRFPAPCRCLSSHSGPLESRRRLGKRNMAGLMPSTSAYPPLWHFNVASIPGTWKWEAPTSQDERRRKEKSLGLSGHFNRFIRWLEKADADRPFIEPPPLDGIGSVSAQSVVTGEDLLPGPAVADTPVPKVYGYPADFPKEVMKLRANIMLLEEMDDDALHHLCKTCRRSLQRRVERRQFSAEGLLLALEPFDQEILSRIPNPHIAGKFAAMIRRTILSAMITVQGEDPDAPLEHLWLAYADWLCASGGGHSNMQLFWRLLQGIPEPVRDRIPPDQLFALTRSFITGQATRHNIFKHWVARAQNFSEIYGGLGASQRERLQADVSAFLADEVGDWDTNRRMRVSWLVAQAHDEKTSDEALVRSYQSLLGSQGLQLNSVQLWQFIAGRAQAHGGITKEALSRLVADEDITTSSQRWAALFSAVLGSARGKAAFEAICVCLRELGELEMAAAALLSAPVECVQVDCVQALAAASNDHRFALRLYHALEGKGVAKADLRKHFSWEAWAPYVQRMITDAQLESPHINRLLGLVRIVHKNDPEMLAKEVAAKVELLDRMGHWYMQTRHLSERQLLRRIEECAAIQRRLMDRMSPGTLSSLASVIVRDLDKGDWGRTTRLEWLLRLVAQLQGEQKAQKAASVLKGWRGLINRMHG
ncbi:hypothetical protein ESCO_004805 [Escovopsis weberi]|uniref:Uncharacterized protein n=1 Tax=Escovopsis weberi TaxID=150374 RepID=A0A0M8MZ99_ESCWE|nr:hypothetical protein ESCO_004805 [Escovopsis weberi]